MEELYLTRIRKLEARINELEGMSNEEMMYFPEPTSDVKLTFRGDKLKIEYDAFDGHKTIEIDPFVNHNVPDFIAACINYFRWDNALYDDNEYEEIIDINDEVIRYKNFRPHY